MQFIAILLVLYAVVGVSMSAWCDEDCFNSRHEVAQANWSNHGNDSPRCCDTCFCCSILIVTEAFIRTPELQVLGTSTVLPLAPPPSRGNPSVYHPPKAA
jgi:hypothetical protein